MSSLLLQKTATTGDAARALLSRSSFGLSVGGVVGVGSEEEMIWVDTARVIAVMQDAKTIRNRTVREFPGNAVCRQLTPRKGRGASDAAITRGASGPRPEDAPPFVRRSDEAAEACFQWCGLPQVEARLGTEFPIPEHGTGWMGFEPLAALLTYAGDRHDGPPHRFVALRAGGCWWHPSARFHYSGGVL